MTYIDDHTFVKIAGVRAAAGRELFERAIDPEYNQTFITAWMSAVDEVDKILRAAPDEVFGLDEHDANALNQFLQDRMTDGDLDTDVGRLAHDLYGWCKSHPDL